MFYRSTREQVVDAIQVTEPVDVRTPGGVLHAEAGDWLILDDQGNLNRYDNVNFQCTFEVVVDPNKYATLDEGTPCGC